MSASLPASSEAQDIPGFKISEIVHESGPRIIYRAIRESDGEPVILKTLVADYPRKQDLAELRREFRIAERLDIPGVIRVFSLQSYGNDNLFIEMEPFGLSLSDYMTEQEGKPFPVDRFLDIAIDLARTLGLLHEEDLVHKDVVPRNVLIDPDALELRLIDFGISSELSRERQSITISKRLKGSLPYISPEQTGRMNRDVDYRSDYYSLGVTFFELLTGRLPFEANDALEWVHRHISHPPVAAHKLDSNVPEQLSKIVMKLMSKNAEDRYQSTFGLVTDLVRCRDEYARDAVISGFELGESDLSRNFRVPQKLYGRKDELEKITRQFDIACGGAIEFCLVSGYSGIGKSALVNEFGQSVASKRGYLIQGKFDQLHQGSAYSAIATAFRGLIQQLLGEPDGKLDTVREKLNDALGQNAQIIIDLIPELELIIGEQPQVAALSPTEAQNRFQIVFLKFASVFADRSHPLVIFIDDLQWSDVPTLNLLQRLLTSREMSHLYIIGAYRSNAVDSLHPLRVTLDQIEKTRNVTEIKLRPLERSAVDELLADTLCTDKERCEALGDVVFDKTQANPFFINELLKSLHEENAILFDPDNGRWYWDMPAVRSSDVGDNVVDFMVASLRRLDDATQRVLQLAACIGNRFDLMTLSIISEQSMDEVSSALTVALERNIVIPLSENYKYVAYEDITNDGVNPDGRTVSVSGNISPGEAMNPEYRFQHDRIQQAAYALIDTDLKRSVHLSIGRLIRDNSTEDEQASRLIEIVNHMNEGVTLIQDADEQRQLALFNLDAGIKAQASSAYDASLGYLETGLKLLGDDAWQSDYDYALRFCKEIQQCTYLTGRFDEADEWTEKLLDNAGSSTDKAEIYSARTRQYATTGRMKESIQSAFAGMSLLGIELNDSPDDDDIAREIADVKTNLDGRAIPDLIHAAHLQDPQIKIAIHLLMEIFPAAFLSGSGNLFPYLVLKSVNLSLRHGNSSESAFAYAAYGMLLCGSLKDPAVGFEYGKLAVAMNEQFDDITLKSRIIYVYAMFIHHWSNHWSTMTPWFLKGIEAGYQSGDMLYLAYSAQDCIIWDPKLNLDVASKEQRQYLRIVKDCEYQDSYDSGSLFLQMILNFQGLTDSLYSMNDEAFDEDACLDGMRRRQFMTGIANYHIYKAEIHYFYDDYAGAYEHVEVMDQMIASSMSLPQLVRFFTISFLTQAALYSGSDKTNGLDHTAVESRLNSDLQQMERWAEVCPENFTHLCLMMRAELSRLQGSLSDALDLYEEAIEVAKNNSFRRDEAMANELAGKCLLDQGLTKAAYGYLNAARYLYYRWGGLRKVAEMEKAYPELSRNQLTGATVKGTLSTRTEVVDSVSLDMSSVMKASRTISGEIRAEKLWKTTMHILMENAGGQKGSFITLEDDQVVIQYQGEVGVDDAVDTFEPVSLYDADDIPRLPMSIINSVLRSGQPLVVGDATETGQYSSDSYIIENQPRSIICIPVKRHGGFSAAIYIENNLTTGAFTEDRVEVIKLLSAQASISMENARLYENQVRLIDAQQRFVPSQFLESLGHKDIADVGLGEHIAREMSVMFADLRDFTPLAERLGPGLVIKLLNRYFNKLGDSITGAGGFIDSFNGDEVMALFALPTEQAVSAGIDMCRSLETFNRESKTASEPELKMGLGVNTGELILGTVGATDRLKCGVVGDTVNLASRIESLTKLYHAPFLIGEHTYLSLDDADMFSIRLVDYVAVKGKQTAIRIYEVLDAESSERQMAKESTRQQLKAAQEYYFVRDFAMAHSILSDAMTVDPEDTVLSILYDRCKRYMKLPPPQDWQGYEVM